MTVLRHPRSYELQAYYDQKGPAIEVGTSPPVHLPCSSTPHAPIQRITTVCRCPASVVPFERPYDLRMIPSSRLVYPSPVPCRPVPRYHRKVHSPEELSPTGTGPGTLSLTTGPQQRWCTPHGRWHVYRNIPCMRYYMYFV